MVSCFALTASVVPHGIEGLTPELLLSVQVDVASLAVALGFILLWHAILVHFQFYRSRRLSPSRSEIEDIAKAVTVGSLALFALSAIFPVRMIDARFVVLFWAGNCAVSISSRLMLRHALKMFRIRGRNLRMILIVGTNPRAIRFAREIESRPELGYVIVGFADADWENLREFEGSGYKVVSGLNGLPDYLRRHVVDEVVVCLPVKSFYQRMQRIVKMCQEQGIVVRFLANIFSPASPPTPADEAGEEEIVSMNNGTICGWQAYLKRLSDLLLGLVLVIAFSPVFVVVSLLIRIASAGPVFFVQERLGVNKRRFRLYKFRTMVADAEWKQGELAHLNEVDGPAFKIRNDPRITPIGRILRKMSIDELPQLFNVIKGDMSLVGPRPLPVRDYEGFSQDWHRRRFCVRPGITCLWQINGRSNTSFDQWMRLDMQYIDQWSLLLDWKILLKTIPVVLKGNGAS